jgi:hypothetical protein
MALGDLEKRKIKIVMEIKALGVEILEIMEVGLAKVILEYLKLIKS